MNSKNLNHTRTKGQRELDLVDVAQLYIRGEPQHKIAEWIGAHRPYTLSRQQIQKDIKLIQSQWRDAYLMDLNEMKAKELARIDELERAYWAEWEKSRADEESVQTEKVTDANLDAEGKPISQWTRQKVKALKKKREGATAYLDGIQWCIQQRCLILGLNAPKEVNVNWREEATKMGINPDELEDTLVDQFIAAAQGNKLGAGSPD